LLIDPERLQKIENNLCFSCYGNCLQSGINQRAEFVCYVVKCLRMLKQVTPGSAALKKSRTFVIF